MIDRDSNNRPTGYRLGQLHRHFHGKWSSFALLMGAGVHLGGLIGLTKTALGG